MSEGVPDPASNSPLRFPFRTSDGPARLRQALIEAGIAHFTLECAAQGETGAGEATDLDFALASRAPWVFVERLFGERPSLVERQTIRSLPNGRNFATGRMPAPFHTDSQCFLGTPPHVQLMLCVRPALRGGENRFLDSWSLLERLEREDPALLVGLFERHRRIPFVFGDFFGPTVSWRGDSLVFTQAARVSPGDELERRLAAWLERIPPVELYARAGEIVAIHNHRMLHGRRGFEDESREFLRLLVWLRRPLPSPPRFAARAGEVSERASRMLPGFPAPLRRRFGLEPRDREGVAAHRLELVLEMLRGVPPGAIARRERIAEPRLYLWRDAALAAALTPLGSEDPESDDPDLDRALLALE